MTRPGSGEVPRASPPARFPLWGLAGVPTGARWLDSFGDAIGDEIRRVTLAHSSEQAGDLIMVETCSRHLTDAMAARGGETALQSVSFGAAFTLVNLTLPEVSVPRPEGLTQALVSQADEWSRRHEAWTPVTWQVDGVPVPARAWRFADGWAAFSDVLDDVYLTAAGSGGSPDGLALARLRDGLAYNFDLEQPLDIRAIQASSAAAYADGEPTWRHATWHADQLRLLSGYA
jgi:hypothetical protein